MKFAARFLFVVLLLFSINYSLFTTEAFAASPPNPQPCVDPLPTEMLTDNYITNEKGEAPFEERVVKTGTLGQSIPVTVTKTIEIDLSKLQALFGSTNSNFLEAKFQDDPHRLDNVISYNGQDRNLFYGPGQKTAPKLMVDNLRKKYVEYVYENPQLPESSNKYTDIKGEGDQKTIYDFVNEYGLPNPPTSLSTDEEKDLWNQTWGSYWQKIPTAYREFYKGKIEFRATATIKMFELINKGEACPLPLREPIEFVMPEFARTVSISDQLNQVIVPCSVQSYRHGQTEEENNCGQPPQEIAKTQNQNVLSQTVNFCKSLIASSTKGLSKTLRKVLKASLDFLSPLKPVYALSSKSCIKILDIGKEGQAPYCALPTDQLRPGDSCNNPYGDDPNRLNKANQNVVCRFTVTFNGSFTVSDAPMNERTPADFDACFDLGDTTYSCNVTVKIWPVIRIPLLSEAWNNTLYSDDIEGSWGAGVGSFQQRGRPGIYSSFIPKSATAKDQKILADLEALKSDCSQDPGSEPFKGSDCENLLSYWQSIGCTKEQTSQELAQCLGYTKKKPGEVPLGNIKQRFIGSVDSAKEFVRDFSLKPKAIRDPNQKPTL